MAKFEFDKLCNHFIVSGYYFQGSEIYGGLSNTWDYGPLGSEIKQNIRKMWWKKFVQESTTNVGIDAAILMNPKVWEATGHVSTFNDPLIDCKHCKQRFRADQLIESEFPEADVNGMTNEQMMEFIRNNHVKCPNCGSENFTDIRQFNMMFKTHVGVTEDSKGESIQIAAGDVFFTELNERLKALEMINGRNMEADVEVAIARVKMYMADIKKLIQYTDLYENITEQLLKNTQAIVYGPEYPSATLYEKSILENTSALSILLPMSIVSVRWAEKVHYDAIVESLNRIANREINRPSQYYDQSMKLNHMLDTAYLYGLGIACLYYKKYALLDRILKVKFIEYDHLFSPYIIDQDNCWIADKEVWNNSTNYSRLKTPFSTTMGRALRPYFTVIGQEELFFSFFCAFEKMLAMYYYWLICKVSRIEMYPPMGMFCWQPAYLERSHKLAYSEFFESVGREQSNHLVIKSGMFDGSYDLYKESYEAVTELEKKARASMY